MTREGFDQFATAYEADLNRGLSLSGESQEYFAAERVKWLAARSRPLRERRATVLDFGCGLGATTPLLLEHFDEAPRAPEV